MADAFTPYETDLARLLERLGSDHSRYADALVYQQRLQENIAQARRYGDTDALKHARAQIVDSLTRLSLDTVGVSFSEKGLAEPPTPRNVPIINLPLRVMLLFNLVVAVMLALALGPPVSLPCVSPQASALSQFVILLLLFHLVWRYLNPVIKEFSDSVKVGSVAVPIKVLASLFDALHPWILSDPALWMLAIVLSLAVGLLGISPLSPFHIQETPPIIQNFLVHYVDSHTEIFAAGDFVEIPAYASVLVEAVLSDQADVSCTWSAVKGTQLPAKGCATRYSPPLEGNQDALSVVAQSPCKIWQAFAGLHINVVQVQPQP